MYVLVMTHVKTIIEQFGGIRAMAKTLGHNNPSTVQGWKMANRIPHWRVPEIEQAAKRAKITIPEIPQSKAQ